MKNQKRRVTPHNMRKLTTPYFLVILFILFSPSTSKNTLTPAQTLSGAETLVSSGGAFALGFFNPSNNTSNTYLGIWYNNIQVHTVAWVANRRNPVTSPATLTITSSGSLIIQDHNTSYTISSSNTSNPVLQLLDNGNLVVSDEIGNYAWQSFDYPTDTLLPGMKLGWNLLTNLNRNLTAWRSPTDPAPGDYVVAMDIRGDPQLTVFEGTVRRWRSGPWDGREITGIPEMLNYTGFNFHFVINSTDIYYSYDVTDPTIITRLMVNESGTAQRYVWLEDTGQWSLFWYTPKTPCDAFSPCGPYGLCDPNKSPMCSCLEGFKPKNQQEWLLRDGSNGCMRKTKLSCGNGAGSDGFMKVSNAWLPDTSVATVDRGMSLDDCRKACSTNCSCTGFSSADVRGGGSGCIIWASELQDLEIFVNGGQDLYVRLASSDIPSMTTVVGHSHKKKEKTVVAATVSIIIGGLLLVSITYLIWRKKREQRGNTTIDSHWPDESSRGDEDLELPILDLATVIAATDNFKLENKLGEGGFGSVYKGKLTDGQEIAVKRLSKTSIQGTDEFKNEVTLIAKLQHRNLVRLLGCCIHAEERMLIYEYMQNKSLDAFLFDKVDRVHLDWSKRYRIIMGVARGLLYLHQDSRLRIIHRDLKASNILLDQDMNPKISDFGMARIFGGDEAITKTRRVVGTYGYMSPEYAMDGIFSVKSDVFSFGVLVLEIISGRKNKGVYISEPHLYLLGTAWILWSEGKCLELMDQSLEYTFSIVEIVRCIKVGLLCVQERPEDRPTMPSVVLMLSSDGATLPDPKQPGFVAKREASESKSTSTEKDWNSGNELTVTMSVGR